MKGKSYLVPFEDLFGFLTRYKLLEKLSQTAVYNAVQNQQHEMNLIGGQKERYHDTWWEVFVPTASDVIPRCVYVADSLKDALRLRPNINISHWSCSFETSDQYLSRTEGWEEEYDLLDSAVWDDAIG